MTSANEREGRATSMLLFSIPNVGKIFTCQRTKCSFWLLSKGSLSRFRGIERRGKPVSGLGIGHPHRMHRLMLAFDHTSPHEDSAVAFAHDWTSIRALASAFGLVKIKVHCNSFVSNLSFHQPISNVVSLVAACEHLTSHFTISSLRFLVFLVKSPSFELQTLNNGSKIRTCDL